MKHSNTRRFYAFVLAMMAVSSLSACTQTERTMTETPGGTSEVRGYEEQQGAGNVSRVEQTQDGEAFFHNLQKGQPVNYYTQEFQRMGYEVTDVNRMGDKISYDLRKGDERFMVNLTTDERNNQMVSNIESHEYRRVGAAQTGQPQGDEASKNQEMNKIVQEVDKLQPGKKPVDYLPMLSKWGDVKKFNSDDDKASAEIETPKNQNFKVEMTVDPQRNVVTDLNVDKQNFWSI